MVLTYKKNRLYHSINAHKKGERRTNQRDAGNSEEVKRREKASESVTKKISL